MSDYVSKVMLPTGIEEGTYFDLSTDHVSTADFGQFTPVYNKEMVPGEHIQINMETYTRLSPLFKPAFARVSIHNKAFFVPFRTVMPKWNDFINDVSTSYVNGSGIVVFGKIDSVPTIKQSELVGFFGDDGAAIYGTSFQITASADISAGNYDVYQDDGTGVTYYKLTVFGRQCMKILTSLGYNINGSYDSQSGADQVYSAMPILCLLKIYYDWYSNSQYSHLNTSAAYLNRQYSWSMTSQELSDIMEEIAWIQYDQDYFTSAWDNPMSPNNGTESNIIFNDNTFKGVGSGYTSTMTGIANGVLNSTLTQPFSSSAFDQTGAATITAQGNSSGGIGRSVVTQYALDMVKHLQDYLKRHQLVGARALDRFLARYGKTLPSEKLNRSNYLGANNVNVRIGDIYSTTDNVQSGGAGLGAYAGAGSGYDANGNFDYKTDEFGMIIIVSTIIPKIGYFQGVDATNKHLGRLDFWTPEFDGVGSRAIPVEELYSDVRNPLDAATADDVWGFVPRYAEYKRALSRVSGDYRVHTASTDYNDSWHLNRVIPGPTTPGTSNGTSNWIKHQLNFCSFYNDARQYDRIFQGALVSGNVKNNDFFNMLYLFNVSDYAPMCSLYDGYDFESEGKKITATINGTQLN